MRKFIPMRTVNKDPMRLRLLPHTFKYVGFTIAGTTLLSLFLAIFGVIPKPFFKSHYDQFFWPVVAAGLCIAAMSKEKKEDEMILAMRLRAAMAGLLFGGGWPIWSVIFSFIPFFRDHLPQFDAPALMCVTLFFYHGLFRTMKRRARNEKYD